MSVKEHIAGNVEFQYYRAGNLMYRTSTGLEFAVPISDTNEATFPRIEKGIFFMRWIRKHLAEAKETEAIEPSKFATINPEFIWDKQ